MEDLFWVFFVVIFVVGPLLEKMRKGGAAQRPPQRPPQRRPLPGQQARQRPLPPRAAGGQLAEQTRATTRSDEDNATDLLPADLWEMLTGQRPSHGEPMRTGSRRPTPVPEPDPEPGWEEVALTRQLPEGREKPVLRDRRAEGEALQLQRRREVEASRTVRRELPVAVSLEVTPRSESVRHAEFHRKLDSGLAPAAEVQTGSAIVAFRIDQMNRTELQRAVLLREILGTPKGLE